MFSSILTVKNKTGLHARPASMLVALCQKFESRIEITYGDVVANPKSIISLLSAGIHQGTVIELTAEGPDEEKAGQEVVALIESLTD